ncbi:MAG: ABC transporter permease [Pirellulaceae bacterium]
MLRERRIRDAICFVLVSCGLLTGVMLVFSRDARVAFLLRNTLVLGLGTNVVALPVGASLAFLLLRTDIPGRRAGIGALTAVLFLPLYLQAAAWDAAFGYQGWLSLTNTAFITPLFESWMDVIKVDPRAIWIHGLAAVPWVVFLVGIGLRLVEPELEDAASLDASPWRVFQRVTLVRSIPAIAVAALWVFVMTAGEIAVTDLYQVRTYAEEVYINVPLLDSAPNREDVVAGVEPDTTVRIPSGTGWMGLLSLATLLVAAYLAPTDSAPTVQPRKLFSMGRWRWAGCLLLVAAGIVLVGLPLGNLTYKAGLVVEQTGQGWWRYWSVTKCLWTVGTSPLRFQEEFTWSVLIGSAAATAALALAGPFAWSARRNTVGALPALCIVAICLALPGPIIGLRIIRLLNQPDSEILIWLYDRTILPPVMAQVIRCLPITILVCWYAFRNLSEEVLEMATLDGAGAASRFLHVGIPQRLTALIAAWWIALAVSLGDLSASNLTLPPGVTTVPVRVFGLLHAGVDDQVAGICLTMTLVSFLVAGVTVGLVRRAERDVQRMATVHNSS